MTRNPAHFNIPMTIIAGIIFTVIVTGGAYASAVLMQGAVDLFEKHIQINVINTGAK